MIGFLSLNNRLGIVHTVDLAMIMPRALPVSEIKAKSRVCYVNEARCQVLCMIRYFFCKKGEDINMYSCSFVLAKGTLEGYIRN